MKPNADPLWNREYINQRLREKRVTAEMKRIAEQPIAVDTSAEYWFGEYLEQKNRVTELETEVEKLKIVVKALLSAVPTQRITTIKEVW